MSPPGERAPLELVRDPDPSLRKRAGQTRSCEPLQKKPRESGWLRRESKCKRAREAWPQKWLAGALETAPLTDRFTVLSAVSRPLMEAVDFPGGPVPLALVPCAATRTGWSQDSRRSFHSDNHRKPSPPGQLNLPMLSSIGGIFPPGKCAAFSAQAILQCSVINH